MEIHRERENESDRRPAINRGGESTGGPPRNPTPTERAQARTMRVNSLVLKDELTLHQAAAEELTQAGLGTYSFTVAERQIIPATGKPLPKGSLFIAVTYEGQEDREKLWEVVYSATDAKKKAEREEKSKKEVKGAVRNAIEKRIQVELDKKARFNAMMDEIQRKKR